MSADRVLCLICSKTFKNKYILKGHIALHNNTEKVAERAERAARRKLRGKADKVAEKWKCEICSKIFAENSDLSNHMRISHPDFIRSFDCHMCTETFQDKLSLKEHNKAKHALLAVEERLRFTPVHECNYCGMNFRSRKRRNSHINFRCPAAPNKNAKRLREI